VPLAAAQPQGADLLPRIHAYIEMKLTAGNATAYKDLVAAVTKAAAEGAAAENAFRGVKAGNLTAGAPATVRCSVKPF